MNNLFDFLSIIIFQNLFSTLTVSLLTTNSYNKSLLDIELLKPLCVLRKSSNLRTVFHLISAVYLIFVILSAALIRRYFEFRDLRFLKFPPNLWI